MQAKAVTKSQLNSPEETILNWLLRQVQVQSYRTQSRPKAQVKGCNGDRRWLLEGPPKPLEHSSEEILWSA